MVKTTCSMNGSLVTQHLTHTQITDGGQYSSSVFFFFSSRRRHTRFDCDWSSDVCSSDLGHERLGELFHCFIECFGRRMAFLAQYFVLGGKDTLDSAHERTTFAGEIGEIGRASCRERV